MREQYCNGGSGLRVAQLSQRPCRAQPDLPIFVVKRDDERLASRCHPELAEYGRGLLADLPRVVGECGDQRVHDGGIGG